jgi:hypothetical protein
MKRLVTLLAFLVSAAPAHAATTSCKGFQGSSLGIIKIRATNVGCKTARSVARGWEFKSSHGASTKTIYDRHAHKWRCRITEEATGTDPGYNPYTRVRCTRANSVVRFALAS